MQFFLFWLFIIVFGAQRSPITNINLAKSHFQLFDTLNEVEDFPCTQIIKDKYALEFQSSDLVLNNYFGSVSLDDDDPEIDNVGQVAMTT
ncbi:hypothetical protein BpHYR1_052860 [Brachionus plicatilis]|uniref:Uncharacterized protein n=1 Tax=Brachionus plicatilis TaxID=10195 RepID=A0A3M7RJG2_BRAPC|nr:hypothetical protein BpHYR1_052860 [Brachionus plicatilis]